MQNDPEPYRRFIGRAGEPALELGCGDGDPLLDLVAGGLDVEGLDSSADMLDRCRRNAADRGVAVTLHHQSMETFELPRRYGSIFLAGATFNLVVDHEGVARALRCIRTHLAPGGSVMIPLFIPKPDPESLGRPREAHDSNGRLIRVTAVSEDRDEGARQHRTTLRYERFDGEAATVIERVWILHWHSQESFAELARSAGLSTVAVLDQRGGRASKAAATFTFILTASE